MHHKWKEIIDIVCKKTSGKIIEDELLTKSPKHFKDYSLITSTSSTNVIIIETEKQKKKTSTHNQCIPK
jgi:hypothetical protein